MRKKDLKPGIWVQINRPQVHSNYKIPFQIREEDFVEYINGSIWIVHGSLNWPLHELDLLPTIEVKSKEEVF